MHHGIESAPRLDSSASLDDLRAYARTLLSFLGDFSFLFRYDYRQTYVNAFLLHNHWETRVPAPWRECLTPSFSLQNLLDLARGNDVGGISGDSLDDDSFPPMHESLSDFVLRARRLRLCLPPPTTASGSTEDQQQQLPYPLNLRMKVKKQHEIVRLLRCVKQEVALLSDSDSDSPTTTTIVDLGCGVGYLTSALAFDLLADQQQEQEENLTDHHQRYHIIGVDSDERQIAGFRRRCAGLAARKDLRGDDDPELVRRRNRVRCEEVDLYVKDLTQVDAGQIVSWMFHQQQPRPVEEEEEGEQQEESALLLSSFKSTNRRREVVVLLALHGCGDLTPASLRLFVELSQRPEISQAVLLNVSCCYFKLSRKSGFPLSRVLQQQQQQQTAASFQRVFGTEDEMAAGQGTDFPELALGCFAVQKWGSASEQDSTEKFRLRSFRFALEVLLVESGFKKKEKQQQGSSFDMKFNGRNVPRRAVGSFAEYARWALQKIGSPRVPSEFYEQENFDANMEKFYARWNPDVETGVILPVACFWCLRGIVAPLMEALVVVDRVISLRERGVRFVEARRIFAEEVSPRSLILVGKS